MNKAPNSTTCHGSCALRRLGIATSIFLIRSWALVLLSGAALECHAQFDSTIYGLAISVGTPNSFFLSRIEPSTGVVSNISPSSIATSHHSSNATIDTYNNIYYFVDQDYHIVGVSLLTGAIVTNQPISNPNGDIFSQMQFNCSDSSVYGLAVAIGSPNEFFLGRIDPSTGSVENLSTASVATSHQGSNATLDPYQGIYYFVDQDGHLIGLSTATGAIVSDQPVSNPDADLFNQIVFHGPDSTIYGLAVAIGTPNEFYLGRIEPSTGIVSNLSTTSLASSHQVANATIDPYTGTYYFVDQDFHLIGASLVTGAMVSDQPITNPNGSQFSQMLHYNKACSNEETGIAEYRTAGQIQSVYPIPAAQEVTIHMERNGDYWVQLINCQGQQVLNDQVRSTKRINLDVSMVTNGFYLLKITDGKYSDSRRIVILK